MNITERCTRLKNVKLPNFSLSFLFLSDGAKVASGKKNIFEKQCPGAIFPQVRATIGPNAVGPLQYDRAFLYGVERGLLGTMLPSNPQSIRAIARWGNSAFMM